jgi:hypothetical protein
MLIALNEFINLLLKHKEASAELCENNEILKEIVRAFKVETAKTRRILSELNKWQSKYINPDTIDNN